jgi:Tfp pilus assembly protein PilO
MKALFSVANEVPWARVVSEQRRWLWPIALVLAVNIIVLVAVVLPLQNSVTSGALQAADSERALQEAIAELKLAEATRDGQSQAARDLDRFYGEVLPTSFTAARRITHVKLAQLAQEHGVEFQRGATTPEILRDSTLERLRVSCALAGDWDDIRKLIYAIETGPDFLVIDNLALSEGADTNAPLSLTLDLSTYYRTVMHAR